MGKHENYSCCHCTVGMVMKIKYNTNTIKYQPKIKDIEIEWYNLPGFAISRE